MIILKTTADKDLIFLKSIMLILGIILGEMKNSQGGTVLEIFLKLIIIKVAITSLLSQLQG